MTANGNAGPEANLGPAQIQISSNNGAIVIRVPAKFKAEAVPTNKDGNYDLPTLAA